MDYRHLRPSCSLHARIVQDIGMDIVGGRLLPGDRMTAEVTLCDTYRVSRSVLREATRVLAAKGLIVSKPRVGSVVLPRCEWHILDPDVLFWTLHSVPHGTFFESLLAVRCVIEPAAAALAASHRSEQDLAAIELAYTQMAAADSPAASLAPDIAFHRAIMQATHNDMLAYIGTMLSQALLESIRMTSRHPDTQQHALPRHQAILTAIRSGDALGARQASLVQLDDARLVANQVWAAAIEAETDVATSVATVRAVPAPPAVRGMPVVQTTSTTRPLTPTDVE